jgi:hypothetical protein
MHRPCCWSQQSKDVWHVSPASVQHTPLAAQLRGEQHWASSLHGTGPFTQVPHVPLKLQTRPLQHSVSSAQVALASPQHAAFVHG